MKNKKETGKKAGVCRNYSMGKRNRLERGDQKPKRRGQRNWKGENDGKEKNIKLRGKRQERK